MMILMPFRISCSYSLPRHADVRTKRRSLVLYNSQFFTLTRHYLSEDQSGSSENVIRTLCPARVSRSLVLYNSHLHFDAALPVRETSQAPVRTYTNIVSRSQLSDEEHQLRDQVEGNGGR